MFCIITGFLAGLLCSLGGALKDCPFEGFQKLKFTRSIFVGTFWGIIAWQLGFKITDLASFLLVMAFCGYLERIVVEGYKIMRWRMPGKFELINPSMLGSKLGFKQQPRGTEFGFMKK